MRTGVRPKRYAAGVKFSDLLPCHCFIHGGRRRKKAARGQHLADAAFPFYGWQRFECFNGPSNGVSAPRPIGGGNTIKRGRGPLWPEREYGTGFFRHNENHKRDVMLGGNRVNRLRIVRPPIVERNSQLELAGGLPIGLLPQIGKFIMVGSMV
jgi:hypothetical protein